MAVPTAPLPKTLNQHEPLLKKTLYSFALILLLINPATRAETPDFHVTPIASGLDYPWSVAFFPNGDYLVTEKSGTLLLIDQNGSKKKINGLNQLGIVARRQGGLLDVVLHPDFETNKLIYFSYVARGYGGTGTEVARGRLHHDYLENIEVIFKASPKMRGDVHFGSRLLFDSKHYLYITLGERFQMDKAQDFSNHHGTIIRLHDDGRIPDDNPFINNTNALPDIYSYGHRNVQGIALQPGTDTIWIHEHGPQGGDEVNILKAGANYGWPVITYGVDYDDSIISNKTKVPGMEQPVIHWTPSIAPCGMAFYNNDLYVGALAGAHLRYLNIQGHEIVKQTSLLEELQERIRDVKAGPDGHLYVLTDSADGQLLRLENRGQN